MMNFKWEVDKMHTVNYVDLRMHLSAILAREKKQVEKKNII